MTGQIQNAKIESVGRVGQNLALVLLLLLYLLVALAHAYLAPLTTGPDELAHYEYVRFIVEHGRLPHTYEERAQASYKSDQPPLFHLLTALPTSLVDPTGPPFLKRVFDHPRRQLIERTRHAWGLYNTEDEQWPYRAEVLRWHVGRWLAIFFGAMTVVVSFFIAREVFGHVLPPPSRGRGGEGVFLSSLGAAAIVAFIPRFALTGSMLNYETTLAFFASLFLWGLLRISVSANGRKTWWRLILLGLFTGLAITTKLSALILPLEVLVALWLIGRYKGWTWVTWLRAVLATAVVTLVVVSWWFGFIVYQFNTVAEDGWWAGLLRPLIAADASDATTNRLLSTLTGGQAGFTGAIENLGSGPPWEWLAIFFRTFWVVGIEGHQPLGWLGLTVALLLCLLAAYGLINIWRQNDHRPVTTDNRHSESSPHRLVLSLLLLHLMAPLILPLLRYAITFSLADTAQGRHALFMAVPACAILLIWGLSEGVSRITYHVSRITYHVSRFNFLIPGVFLLFWSSTQLWHMTWAYVPLLPVRTVPEAEAQAVHQLDQPMNDYVTLVGYDSQIDEGNQMMRLDLIWQATALSPFDYLTEVSLVDAQGDVQAQWLGYPANGRYPPRAWDVGDIVRDTVWLSLAGLQPDQYQIKLDLLPPNLNPPLEPTSPLPASPLTLTTLTLQNSSPPPAPGPRPPAPNFQVWQNGEPLTAPRRFGYRETVLVTVDPTLSGQQYTVQIISPGGACSCAPARELNNTVLFIIGPDWTTGDYRVQVTLEEGEQQIVSEPLLELIDRWQRQYTQPPMQQVVEANFANQVKLLGYDLGANRVQPGGGIPVTLYWQGLDWLGNDYTIFTKLLAADQTVHGGRDRLPHNGYRTLYWAPGEIITDPFGVPVNADAPDGVYYLNVGLYKEVDQQAVSLPLVQDGQLIDASSINIGPIKIGNAPPGLTIKTADPQVSLNQPFGDAHTLTLLGYDLTDEAGQPIVNQKLPITNLKLTLYWRSESPLPIDYTTFVHLRDAAGQTVAQKDQLPLNGAYPTSLWDPGEIIADEIVISVPAELSAGEYQLVIGLYDFGTGHRLTMPDNPDNDFTLTTLKLER